MVNTADGQRNEKTAAGPNAVQQLIIAENLRSPIARKVPSKRKPTPGSAIDNRIEETNSKR